MLWQSISVSELTINFWGRFPGMLSAIVFN